MTTDRHVIRYRTISGDSYLLTETPMGWDHAVEIWDNLDRSRQEGKFPWILHFEVRAADDPSNPEVAIPVRPHRDDDHPNYIRWRSVRLRPEQHPRVYTFQCVRCGKAFEGSGFAVGSHEGACLGVPANLLLSMADDTN